MIETSLRAVEKIRAFADEFRASPRLRARVDADPRPVLAEKGIDVPGGAEVRVVANTGRVFHFVMLPDPNAALADEMLAVAGGTGRSQGVQDYAAAVSQGATWSCN